MFPVSSIIKLLLHKCCDFAATKFPTVFRLYILEKVKSDLSLRINNFFLSTQDDFFIYFFISNSLNNNLVVKISVKTLFFSLGNASKFRPYDM